MGGESVSLGKLADGEGDAGGELFRLDGVTGDAGAGGIEDGIVIPGDDGDVLRDAFAPAHEVHHDREDVGGAADEVGGGRPGGAHGFIEQGAEAGGLVVMAEDMEMGSGHVFEGFTKAFLTGDIATVDVFGEDEADLAVAFTPQEATGMVAGGVKVHIHRRKADAWCAGAEDERGEGLFAEPLLHGFLGT